MMQISVRFTLLVVLPLLSVQPSSAQSLIGTPKVIDADTLSLAVRLIGIDAPERWQYCMRADKSCYPCGTYARNALKRLMFDPDRIEGRENEAASCINLGTDGHGRPVMQCFTPDDIDIGSLLVQAGWAVVRPEFLQDEPEALDAYLALQTEAQQSRRGLWQGAFDDPSLWRQKRGRVCRRAGR